METIQAKHILQTKKSTSWFGTSYNMNLYHGCNHGCIYCDSRSNCYQISDFNSVRVKENVLEILRDDLRRKVKSGVVATGSMSDPYNSFEKKYEYTRHSLELLSAYEFGVGIATKGTLVTRDIDILQEIQHHSPVIIKMTITTPHDEISKIIEPYAPTSSQRFAAVKELRKGGIFTGLLMMPVLPWIEDDPRDIKLLVEKAAEAGANYIYGMFGLSLRDGQREYFYTQLEKYYPGLKEKYQKRYGGNYSCHSPKAKELYEVFYRECDKYGILYKMKDIVSGYKMGYGYQQFKFF